MRIKNTFQQRLADFAAQFDSAHDMPVNGIAALDDYQRADFLLGQIGERADQNVHGVRAQRPGGLGRETPDRNALKDLSEFFLKDDHNNDQENREKPLEEPGGQLQIEIAGDNINGRKDKNSADDKRRPGLPQPCGCRVKQYRHNQNVDNIGNADVKKWREHSRFSLDEALNHEALLTGNRAQYRKCHFLVDLTIFDASASVASVADEAQQSVVE